MGVDEWFNKCFGVYLVEQLSLSMILSILTFEFDLFLGLSLIFGALMGYFWGKGKVQ